jgi:signal peptidase I
MNRLRRLAAVLSVGAVLLAGIGLASGRVAHVTTSGVSMLPTYVAGDLVVVAKADRYEVGDIAAYRVPGRHLLVLHRIVARDADGGFTLQGDNNQSIDPYTPRADEIVGRAVLHVPRAGKVLSSGLARLVALALLLVVLGVMTVTPSHTQKPAHRAAPRRASRVWRAFLVLDAMLLVAVAAAHVAAAGADRDPAPIEASPAPSQTIDLSYGADVAPSDTYPTGRIVTGDPVFTRLADRVEIRFGHTTDAGAAGVSGTAKLDVRLETAGGWSTTQPLAAETPINDAPLELSATLVLADIRALAGRVAEQTGTPASPVDVTVVASGEARLGGAESVPFEVDLPLQLGPQSLAFSGASTLTDGGPDTGPVVREALAFERTEPGPREPAEPRNLRTPALIALLLAVAATAVSWPTDDDTAAGTIGAPAVLQLDLPVTTARIQVGGRAAVDAIASVASRPVIVGPEWDGVLTAEALYWCRTTAPAPAGESDPAPTARPQPPANVA